MAQITEFKAIMERERDDFETRRKEQDKRLQFLMNMASEQSKGPEDVPVEPESHELATPIGKTKEGVDEWHATGADPWSGEAEKDAKRMLVLEAEIKDLKRNMQESAWYSAAGSAEPQEPQREGHKPEDWTKPEEDAATNGGRAQQGPAGKAASSSTTMDADSNVKELLRAVSELRDEVSNLKRGMATSQASPPMAAATTGSNAGSFQNATGVSEKPVPEMDKKLVPKPDKYAGNDLNKFPIWVEELKAYLEHHDPRFKELLEQIEEAKTPIDPQDSLNIALKIGAVQSKEALDRNLLGYLKAFTSGEALKLVTK